MSIVQQPIEGTGSAEARWFDPDEADTRRQEAWDQQQRLHPPASQARVELLERLETRARRLWLVARDLNERAREERLEVQRIKGALQMQKQLSFPRPVRPDPAQLERVATTERNASRLAAEAEALSVQAQAAQQVATACARYLRPEQVGGPDDARFSVAGRPA